MSVEVPQNPQPVSEGNLAVNPVTQKKSNIPLILLSILVLVLVGSGGFILAKYLYTPNTPKTEVSVSSQPPATKLTRPPSPFNRAASNSAVPDTTDETANWEHYTDATSRLSFRYPLGWQVSKRKVAPNLQEQIDVTSSSDGRMAFTILVTSPADTTLDAIDGEWTKFNANGFRADRTTMFGVQAIRAVLTDVTDGTPSVNFALIYKNKVYMISYPSSDKIGSHEAVFDQILSTFKFL